MSVDRQQMLETAERLNQQMADGIPYTWETLEQALSFVTEKRDKGIHGRICYFAAFYHLDTGNQEQCLKYLDESVRCLLGTDQEIHVARAYNMIGIVAHMQNNLSLAMEQYGRALDYTAKYNDKMVHSIVLSNMADAYYLIGVYDRAVQCYRECIREFEKAGDDSIYSRINFRKMLSEYDSIQNLLQYVEKTGNIELLQEILDCLEPKAAIEQNRSLLLQLLMLRLRYCSAQMSIEEFRQATETFFHIKESSEMIESNQVMYMLELRKRLQAVEEEQREQTKKRNKLLYQSEHDELTGLYNKRSLNRYLEDVFEACKLNEKELGILFLDIDYFKQLNDRYGHGKGDEGICAVADTLKRIFPEDYVARYGGDEFLVVMTGRDLTYVMEHAESLCAGIRECKIPNEDSEVESWLTISVGGVCAIPKEPNRVWDFLSAADNTLYEQKKEQKGKVRFYQGEGKYL